MELGIGRVVLWVVARGCTAVVVVLPGVVVKDETVAVVVVVWGVFVMVICRGVEGAEVVCRGVEGVEMVWGGAAVVEGVSIVVVCRGVEGA